MKKKKCKRCNHKWNPRVDEPIECPNCKRRDWKGVNKNSEF